ncbi:efflux RND transporter permease subunit [Natronincola ferrireducens]|uniref:AcrB/AcrD/AcrF family protein n=1 Tax=Natronincola ferrireducens TaxID=393762 RepID=A0A1G9DV63_9FIRM|nr:efflux RND transporter permease subunit [Natronincola ferrireducens]SDK67753.1 AcrB/AcrD/AcrF family protein [Natronincola ferrireducens]
MGEFRSIDEIKEMPLTLPTGSIIPLKEVAEVELTHGDINTISRVNGKNSINVAIQKQSLSNTVQVANLIHAEIEDLQREYTQIEINTVLDQSTFITQAIDNVFKNAVFGALLAIAILHLFLRNIRTTLIIGTSIPISVIATFILLYFNNITLNLMTLGGLALGIGMLVDNAIVVLEDIYRFRTEGYSRKEAAIKGASEVGVTVTASTLTTIAVFVPITFVGGITSTIFRELAMTVTLSLLASLLVSLTLIPMLSSKILKVTIGIIMLAGIVVNNVIVLVDYINTLRIEGKDRNAAITTTGPIRLRPIMMTTSTTDLGLLPVAIGIGEGAEIQSPMATVVIGALLLSTLLTLVLIPVVYTLTDDFATAAKNKFTRTKEEATS